MVSALKESSTRSHAINSACHGLRVVSPSTWHVSKVIQEKNVFQAKKGRGGGKKGKAFHAEAWSCVGTSQSSMWQELWVQVQTCVNMLMYGNLEKGRE